MKRSLQLTLALIIATTGHITHAATNLAQVYNDALKSDPTYQAAKTVYLSAMQELPITKGALLPSISLEGAGSGLAYVSSTESAGDLATNRDNTTSSRGYGIGLSLSQPLFNYTIFQEYKEAKNTVKEAAATYYNAQQELMVRTANAYFAILQDKDVVSYTQANVEANKRSLDQAKQQFDVGLKTQTDVYTSQAAYSSAVSENVLAQNALENDRENLRAITGKLYPELAKLSDDFPLIKPTPGNIDDWTKVATQHNWRLQAYHYAEMAAMDNIKATTGGHLPTVTLNANYSHSYSYNNNETIETSSGNLYTDSSSASIDFDLPLYEGGTISSQVKQAEYDYQTAVHNMEMAYRTVTTDTRQDFLNIISGISAIEADKISIQSNKQSLEGLEAGYKVGTQTMVDVLNQQSLLLQSQQTYAEDRYAYVDNLISLKYNAGTLSAEDIAAINAWLGDAPAAHGDNQHNALQVLATRYQEEGPLKPNLTVPVSDATPQKMPEAASTDHVDHEPSPNTQQDIPDNASSAA